MNVAGREISEKSIARMISGLVLVLFLMIGGSGFGGSPAKRASSVDSGAQFSEETRPSAPGNGHTGNRGEAEGKLNFIGKLLEGIQVSGTLSTELVSLYEEHRAEIESILKENSTLIVQTLDLVLKALPALSSIEQNEGKLYLDRKTFSKAMDLLGECEKLAGSQLARDLRRAKALVMSKTTDAPEGQVMIDLNQ